MLTAGDLAKHIEGCVRNSRESQKLIYSSFYGYAMSVCNRYSTNYEDAVEILNDGFLKIFKEIYHYKPAYADTTASFKGWLRKIMVYTAIDHFRKNKKHLLNVQIEQVNIPVVANMETALDKLSYDEILVAVKQLSPAYRTVFNLFVIDGLSHEEIANRLGISVGTSKSNLSKARMHLQKKLLKQNPGEYKKHAV